MKKNELIQLIEQKVRQKLSEVVNQQEKRYSATLQCYIYAESDKEAIKEIEKLISELNRKYDNNTQLMSLYTAEKGNLETKKIK